MYNCIVYSICAAKCWLKRKRVNVTITAGRDETQMVNGVLTILRLERKERYATQRETKFQTIPVSRLSRA